MNKDEVRHSLNAELIEDIEDEAETQDGFAIGKIVFPLEPQQKDFVDTSAVLVNDSDTYIGSFLGKYLSEQSVVRADEVAHPQYNNEELGEGEDGGGDEPTFITNGGFWKVLGTLSERRKIVPSFLWAVMKNDDTEGYLKEVLKCGTIIYDVTHNQSPQRFAEIRAVCDRLRSKWPSFHKTRVFILISSLHSWSNTSQPKSDGGDGDDSGVLTEANYRYRRTHPSYRDLQLLERYVVATGKMTKGMVKAYVIGSGIVYGGEENTLHHWFKCAWHNAKHLQVYGDGTNFVPLIHNMNLAKIVQCVMELPPANQRYIIAVDPVIPRQIQLVKAISRVLGNGKVKPVPVETIYLNADLTTFQADQILLDLHMEAKFSKTNFDIDWNAPKGFPSIVESMVEEYRQQRNLTPLKIVILGPPGIGKSTVARQISDLYHIHHFTLEEIILSTRDLLKDAASDTIDPDAESIDRKAEEIRQKKALDLISQIDQAVVDLNKTTINELPEELIAQLIRYRLLTHPCLNQGWILDGFPQSYLQAKQIFIADEESGEFRQDEEDGEGAIDPVDIRLIPERVFCLEAPDGFLKDRLFSLPITKIEERHLENNYEELLNKYRQENEHYGNSIMSYLDEQDVVYVPIDVVADESPFLKQSISFMSVVLGRPRNYGLTKGQEEALLNAQKVDLTERDQKEADDLALLESRELEERQKNIQDWLEKLAQIKKDEFEREENALIPLRNYLMCHVVPTLTRALIDVNQNRPEDPIDYLAEFLFKNNPGTISPINPSNFNTRQHQL